MTIPEKVCRVSLIGHLPQGEIFNTSFWMYQPLLTTALQANELAEAVKVAYIASLQPILQTVWTATTALDEIRVYNYRAGGPKASDIGSADISTSAGNGSGSTMPLQTCACVTLKTGFPGRSKRGRMYLPITQLVTTLHQMDAGKAAAIGSAMAAFFSAVNDITEGAYVCVVSQVGLGSTANVTDVSCDSRLDVQRRHANRQVALTRANYELTA